MIAASGAVTSAAFAELKQQMALRTAEQAEREAESLKSEADEKRQEARDIAEEARNLQLESGQAQNRADTVRASLPPDDLLQQLDDQFNAIISAMNSSTEQAFESGTSAAEQSNGQTINMLGQPTGGTIDITV